MTATTSIVYDTYSAIQRLKDSGMPESQAEAVVREQIQLLENNLATKQDIALVQRDIEDTRADIETLRLETKKDIESLRADVQKEINLSEARLTLKMGGMLAVAIGVLVSLQTLAG